MQDRPLLSRFQDNHMPVVRGMSPHNFRIASSKRKVNRKLRPSNSSKDLSNNTGSIDLRDAKLEATVAEFPDIDLTTPALIPKTEEILEADEVTKIFSLNDRKRYKPGAFRRS